MASWLRKAGVSAGTLFVCFIPLSLFVGCGADSAVTGTPVQPSGIGGNWEFTATESTGATVPFGVALVLSGTTITGTAIPQIAFPLNCTANGCCGGPFAEFNTALTGTADAKGNLQLTSSVPNGGPIFTMSGVIAGGSLGSGTFTLTGACAAQGTISGVHYPNLNGTWAGTLVSKNTGSSYSATATLAQSATLNSRGFFNVSATVNVSGDACLGALTEGTPLEENSGFLGNSFGVTMNGAGGAIFSLEGALAQDGKTFAASYNAGGGSCALDYGTGTLTLQ